MIKWLINFKRKRSTKKELMKSHDDCNSESLSQNIAKNCDNCNPISKDCNGEPKFLVGDRVIISDDERISEEFRGCVGTVVFINSIDKRTVDAGGGIAPACFHVSQLAPYTEPKPKEKTGELNLREMLKGHADDTFYSPIWGEVIVITPHPKDGFRITPKDLQGQTKGYLDIRFDGKAEEGGGYMLFPSRALYEKHPLDAKTAWAEWQEGQNRKTLIKILPKYDGKKSWAEIVANSKFTTLELAAQAAEAVGKTLEEFHKKNQQ